MIPLWEVDMVVTYRTLQGIFQGIKRYKRYRVKYIIINYNEYL